MVWYMYELVQCFMSISFSSNSSRRCESSDPGRANCSTSTCIMRSAFLSSHLLLVWLRLASAPSIATPVQANIAMGGTEYAGCAKGSEPGLAVRGPLAGGAGVADVVCKGTFEAVT